jgi:hypothetical protein
MKAFILLASVLLTSCAALKPTAGNNLALNKNRFPSSNTIIFGRIVDLNPSSIKSKLQITYTLTNENKETTDFPNVDTESDYFWISIPADKVKYFGVSSIRYMINGVTETAVMQDDKTHKPLFGAALDNSKGAKFIYVGDITIRSGFRKTTSGLNLEIFDIHEAYNKSNPASARSYLEEKGVDTKNLLVMPLNLKKI